MYKDKTLLYMVKLTAKLSCGMDFTDYPHDTQICFVMIESLSHTTEDLIFKWNFTDPLYINPEIRSAAVLHKKYTKSEVIIH